MHLFFNQTSPYARKARVAVHELGFTKQVEFVEVDPWAEPSELLAATPLSKVPALVLANGAVVTESDVIVQVLDTLALPGGRLVSADPTIRAEALMRAGLCQGLIDASFIAVIEGRRPAEKRWGEWVEKQGRAMSRALAVVEQRFDLKPGRFDIGDIGLACALAYLDLRHAGINWREGRPRLAAWFEVAKARQSMQATEPR